jgi:hypothetical protein
MRPFVNPWEICGMNNISVRINISNKTYEYQYNKTSQFKDIEGLRFCEAIPVLPGITQNIPPSSITIRNPMTFLSTELSHFL